MHINIEYQKACEEAARAGGAELLSWAGRFEVREKGPADLVTQADLASQEAIRRRLLGQFPDHGFLAEENAALPSRSDGLRWIVDPLDGTTNYVHGLPNYAVSIALEQHGKLLLGTVYDPAGDHCFTAIAGAGATLDGGPLGVSRTTELSRALVAMSFAARVERDSQEIANFIEVLVTAQGVRRMGSAALNLCYLAAGWFDAYWATSTKAWDIAAGALMVQEAGGLITAHDGSALDVAQGAFLAAATPELHRELLNTLRRARR